MVRAMKGGPLVLLGNPVVGRAGRPSWSLPRGALTWDSGEGRYRIRFYTTRAVVYFLIFATMIQALPRHSQARQRALNIAATLDHNLAEDRAVMRNIVAALQAELDQELR